jgi:hypothetical protein
MGLWQALWLPAEEARLEMDRVVEKWKKMDERRRESRVINERRIVEWNGI